MTIKDVQVDCFGLTDCGHVRKVNQDQFLIATMHKMLEIQQTSLPNHTRERLTSGAVARLILVADGVGGSAAGEEASGLALEAVAYYVTTSMQRFYKLEQDLEAGHDRRFVCSRGIDNEKRVGARTAKRRRRF